MVAELPGIVEKRLGRLGTLEARITRADTVEVFKIAKGLVGLQRGDFFEMEEGQRTRGHTLRFHVKDTRRMCIPSVRYSWNVSPVEAVSCTNSTINTAHIYGALRKPYVKYYSPVLPWPVT